MTPALIGHSTTPLRGLQSSDMQPAPIGVAISELAPKTEGPLLCRLNGEWLLRESWGHRVAGGDIIEFHELPADRDSLRGVLQVAIAVVAVVLSQGGASPYVVGAFAAIAGYALNGFLPVLLAQQYDPGAQSPTYSTGLSGNQARLYQPIPKICGRHQTFPPFAAQPYSEFDETGNQYYHALLAIGVGNHAIERIQIDDTDINHFSDVLTCEYLAPGVAPTVVLPNVVNAPEVAGANLEMLTGEYIGGFCACGPRAKATHIGIDIIAPRGLGLSGGDGSIGSQEMKWRVEVRPLNEFGTPVSPWSVLANETRTANTNQVQRWSKKYELDTPMRAEVRVVRTDVRSDSLFALHDANWSGLRAYLQDASPLNEHTAHLELVMRASKQLSNFSQQRVSVIATGMTRTWSPEGGWADEVATRNPAWWLADLWTSTTWGEGVPDERVDLLSIYELAQIWEARQDRFDYVFDTTTTAWDAAQLIARAGRARVFRRGGVRSVARDQLDLLPVTAFTPRNCVAGSMSISEALPTRDAPDGIIVEYFDNRQWDWLPIDCPQPGVTSMSNPVRLRLVGVTGRIHAEREGLYEAASAYYRTRKVELVTEMQGMLPAFLSAVRWQGEISGYGQTGDVAFWDAGALLMGLSEPPRWGEEPLYLTLIRDDGSLTDPVPVTPGAGPNDIVLPAAPDFDLVLDDGTRERPKFLLGTAIGGDELVKINTIEDGGLTEDGAQLFKIGAGLDDERVHHVDEHLLPGPDEIQDPIDTTEGAPGGGTTPVVVLSNQIIFYSDSAWYALRNDGVAHIFYTGAGSGSGDDDIPGEWLFVHPVETDITVLFEVRATADAGLIVNPAMFDTWLGLDATRTWNVGTDVLPGQFLVEIRDVDTETIQDSALITFIVAGGGGD
ncbi:MAG: host specificity factor TipJ family phage tail protein [Rhizobacter sp.]